MTRTHKWPPDLIKRDRFIEPLGWRGQYKTFVTAAVACIIHPIFHSHTDVITITWIINCLKMPPAVSVASTKTRTIIKFSAGKCDRYRFSERDRYVSLPKIEDPESGHCRLRYHKTSIRNFKGILGIVCDDETINWRDALMRLDTERTFVLVLWKGIKQPVWECAADITRAVPAWNEAHWSEIALKQEEKFEEVVILLRPRGNDESGSYVEKGSVVESTS